MSFFKKLKKDLVEDLGKLGLVDKKEEKPSTPSYSGKPQPQHHIITFQVQRSITHSVHQLRAITIPLLSSSRRNNPIPLSLLKESPSSLPTTAAATNTLLPSSPATKESTLPNSQATLPLPAFLATLPGQRRLTTLPPTSRPFRLAGTRSGTTSIRDGITLKRPPAARNGKPPVLRGPASLPVVSKRPAATAIVRILLPRNSMAEAVTVDMEEATVVVVPPTMDMADNPSSSMAVTSSPRRRKATVVMTSISSRRMVASR